MDLTAGRELGVEDTRLRVSGCGPQRAQHTVEAFTDAMVALAFDGVDAPESL